MQKCAKNANKLSNIEKSFLARFFHSAFYKSHISGAANRHAQVQYAKYVVVFFFLISHHDTNPLRHLYHFRKTNIIMYWLILTVNYQGSYFPFFFFCLRPMGQTFLYHSKLCNHLKHSVK